MVVWLKHALPLDEHGLLTGIMWVSDLGILVYHSFSLIYLEIQSWRYRFTFFPVEIKVVSSFFYGLALFGYCDVLLLLVMRLFNLVAKKTVQRPHQPFLKLVILIMKTEPGPLVCFIFLGKLPQEKVIS